MRTAALVADGYLTLLSSLDRVLDYDLLAKLSLRGTVGWVSQVPAPFRRGGFERLAVRVTEQRLRDEVIRASQNDDGDDEARLVTALGALLSDVVAIRRLDRRLHYPEKDGADGAPKPIVALLGEDLAPLLRRAQQSLGGERPFVDLELILSDRNGVGFQPDSRTQLYPSVGR